MKGYLLVTHVSTKPVSRGCLRNSPAKNEFIILGSFVREDSREIEPKVICVTSDNRLYSLKESLAVKLRLSKSFVKNVPENEVADTDEEEERRNKDLVDFPSLLFDDSTYPEEEEGANRRCDCGPCKKTFKYLKNMSPKGRQKLYTAEPSLFDLFKILGLTDFEKDISEACELSVCSFDVESVSVKKKTLSRTKGCESVEH